MTKISNKNLRAQYARGVGQIALTKMDLEALRDKEQRLHDQLFNVQTGPLYLTNFGVNKLQVIKAVREISNLSLRQALDITNSAGPTPSPYNLIPINIDPKDAQRKIAEAGGTTSF